MGRFAISRASIAVLHGGPQPVLVETEHVELGPLAVAARDHRPSLLVHVEHELGGLLVAVPEELLEHERHVRHEVDRIVPDDHDPGTVERGVVPGVPIDVGTVELDGRGSGHGSIVSGAPARWKSPRWNRTVAVHTVAAPAM